MIPPARMAPARLAPALLATGAIASALLLPIARPLCAQVPLDTYQDAIESRTARTAPVVRYVVTPSIADTTWRVEMHIARAPSRLVLRLPIWAPGAYRVVHWARDIRALTITSDGRELPVRAEVDSSRWTTDVIGDRVVVRYTVGYRTPTAPSNRSFLAPSGGLVDGPATYLYLEGEKLLPAHVRFDLPDGWTIATGLTPTVDPASFFAPSYDILADSPALVGRIRRWGFDVDGIPHRIAIWMRPEARLFDSTAWIDRHARMVRAGRAVFGALPYRDYTFLYVNGAGGGLEHLNSTTLGVRGDLLADDIASRDGTIAHEFFHLWNVKRIRPAALGPFDYQHPVRVLDLWFSEGVTDYYADVLLRRSGLADPARARRSLVEAIEDYLNNPARDRLSPERSSWTTWDPPSVNDGYALSYYLSGLLLGEALDLRIGHATDGRRGMDDVMRVMFDRFAGPRGFASEDLLHVVNEVCGCDLQPLFARHVQGAVPLDLAATFALAGLRLTTTVVPVDSAGTPIPDRRIALPPLSGFGSSTTALGGIRLLVSDPTSAWARAGVRSGDELLRIDGTPVTARDQLPAFVARTRIGQRVALRLRRDGREFDVRLTLPGYTRVRATLDDDPAATPAQRALRERWLRGPVTAP